MEELELALGEVNVSSAAGTDEVPFPFLTKCAEVAKEKLLALYNEIWTSGLVPESWRLSVVKPIAKPGRDPSRQTTIVRYPWPPCITQLFERMVSVWSPPCTRFLSMYVNEFVNLRGKSLGFCSEQASESVHHSYQKHADNFILSKSKTNVEKKFKSSLYI